MRIPKSRVPRAVQASRAQRQEIESELLLKGYSYRMIRTEMCIRLGIDKIGLNTIKKDIDLLFEDWRATHNRNMEELVALELTRIDTACVELWDQWNKSKTDYDRKTTQKKGKPKSGDGASEGIKTTDIAQTNQNVVALGNPAYIAEIRKQLEERRKLLGLYAPEKKEVNTNLSFADFLMSTGVEDTEIEETTE